jgi:hypothetical protein
MKSSLIQILIAIVSFSILACSSEDEAERLSGRFVGTQNFGIGQVTSPFAVDLIQNGESVTGSVTPPFSIQMVPIINGSLRGSTLKFDRKEGSVTYRYQATVNRESSMRINLTGSIDPVGCIEPSSGEPCLTDSDGNFNASNQ